MGAGHSHALYVHEHSVIHRLAPQAKVAAALGTVAAVAVTPREAVWAFGLYGLVIVGLLEMSRVPFGFLLARLASVAPFVVFALFIPFIATGETTQILGIEMSVEGLWGAWSILIKAVLGASISILLTATTEVADIVRGLEALRVPRLFTGIASFMIRYLELVADELRRMRTAMAARGYDPRWLSQARPIAGAAGALFIRSYERGERVHAAMLSRGFNGTMPVSSHQRVPSGQWVGVAGVVTLFIVVSTASFLLS